MSSFVPQNLKIAGTALVRDHPAFHSWWWTPARLEKLRYVMTKYDDLEKAARVLSCPMHCAKFRWDKLNKGGKA